MHWLIPSVAHTVLCLLAWLWGTVTPAAAIFSFALAASQSIHLWAIFYGLFAIVFTVGSVSTAILQYQSRRSSTQQRKPVVWTRNVAHFACNLLVVAILVPLHQFYLKFRLDTVPWWHIRRAPYGCLPIPSRTLTLPIRYGVMDAIGNQLPYGIVTSYAVAMACILGAGLRSHTNGVGFRPVAVIVGAGGAATVALAAAVGLPMCGEDPVDGKHEVTMHVDRSVEWKERTPMAWSTSARYIRFVVMIAVGSSYAGLLAAQMASSAWRRKQKAIAAKQASSPRDVKEKASTGQTQTEQQSVGISSDNVEPIDEDASTYHKASLIVNLLVSSAVVMVMAIWSWTGPRAEQTQTLMDF